MSATDGIEQIEAFLDEHDINRVQVLSVLPDGIPFGKMLHPRTFLDSIDHGVGVADYAFGTDRMGEPAFGFTAPWRSTVLGDLHMLPDLATLRAERPGLATCLADVGDSELEPISMCGRSQVKRLVGELAGRGFNALATFEIEGQFFERSFAENRANDWRDLRPFGVASNLPYLAQDMHLLDPVMTKICSRLDDLDVPWEAWNAEAAAGQFEINVRPADPLSAADHVIAIRRVCKEVAHDHGLSVTFMGRVTADYGNGLHIHHSLRDDNGPVMFDEDGPDNLSQVARHWIGGLMATMPGVASVMAPNPNSCRRITAFKAVPTHATWDIDNKSTALRVLSGSPGSTRVEHRMGSGDLHPHFAIAVLLAGGIAGLDGAIDPPARFPKMAWGLPAGPEFPAPLPASVSAACDALDADDRLRRVMGDEFVDYWIGLRRFEWLAFNTEGGDITSDGPTAWELGRYFETL